MAGAEEEEVLRGRMRGRRCGLLFPLGSRRLVVAVVVGPDRRMEEVVVILLLSVEEEAEVEAHLRRVEAVVHSGVLDLLREAVRAVLKAAREM